MLGYPSHDPHAPINTGQAPLRCPNTRYHHERHVGTLRRYDTSAREATHWRSQRGQDGARAPARALA